MGTRAHHLGRKGAAVAAIVGMGCLAIGSAAWADAPASRACRAAIAKGLGGVANAGFGANDACHKVADKAVTSGGPCNNFGNAGSDPKGKFGASKTKAGTIISGGCQPSDPVLANYDGTDPSGTVNPILAEIIGGNSLAAVGSADLAGDKAKTKCLESIGKARSKMAKEVVQLASKCQAGIDSFNTSFSTLNDACVLPATKSGPKGEALISAKCGALTGGDVGSCSPLPGCVTTQTTNDAHDIAKAIYQSVTTTACGNGVIDAGEQCDDGANNGTPGDLCNIKCESLADTCGPGTPAGGSIIGTRTITVSLSVPAGKQLAGVQVGFDYPQLETSIPGTGTSSKVQQAFQALVAPPPSGFISTANDTDFDAQFLINSGENFIGSGDLVKVTLNNCTALAQNVCSRSQNVIGCCPAADIATCNANPDDQVACDCGFLGFNPGAPYPNSGTISKLECATAESGACTTGVCASIPSAPAGSCCIASHAKICTSGANTGQFCTVDLDCDPAPVGGECVPNSDCPQTGKCALSSTNPGKACTAANEANTCAGAVLDHATCLSSLECSRLGDQANGTFGCFSIFNPLGSKIGNFPPVAVGVATPAGACPTNNVCENQVEMTTGSCTVTSPTDALGQIVDGVTCAITVTEAP